MTVSPGRFHEGPLGVRRIGTSPVNSELCNLDRYERLCRHVLTA